MKDIKPEDTRTAMRLTPRNDLDALPVMPQQYGCQRRHTTTIDMITGKGKVSRGPTPTQRTAGDKEMLGVGEITFPGKSTLTGYPISLF